MPWIHWRKQKKQKSESAQSQSDAARVSDSREGTIMKFVLLLLLTAGTCRSQMNSLANAGGQPSIIGSVGCDPATDVREQRPRWAPLSDIQKAEFGAFLRGAGMKVHIHVSPAESSASTLGRDLLSALKASGWETGEGIHPDCSIPAGVAGVVLLINHRDFPEATLLQIALRRAGIPVEVQVDDGQAVVKDRDLIVLAVGSKPFS